MKLDRLLRAGLAVACILALASCGGGSEPPAAPGVPQIGPLTGDSAPRRPQSTAGMEHTLRPPLAEGVPQADGGYSIATSQRELVRLFYKTVFVSSANAASGWNGSIASCNAGDTTAEFKAATLRRINWYRAMAGVPASIQFDATFNAAAGQAALLMAANNALNHFPPSSWLCYTATGGNAAGKSDLALGFVGPAAVDGYMSEPGVNNAPVGHRRWVLYPQTQFMGTGDIDGAVRTNALWVQDANINGPRPAVRDTYVAWPPPGYVPYQTVFPRWSFSYPGAVFTAATVTMTQGGAVLPLRQEIVNDGFGENTLVWIPGGLSDAAAWTQPAGDTSYQVTVSNVLIGGAPRSFTYNVTVFDPDAGAPPAPAVTGSDTATAGQAATYAVSGVAGATAYQWQALTSTPFALYDSADNGLVNFTASTSSGYPVISTTLGATGLNAFHLAHTQLVDQVLQLNRTLYAAGSNASLSFASRLGLATGAQAAMVEASTDGGNLWTPLYVQAGNSIGELTFSTRTISLAALAGRTFQLRFRYAAGTGVYYPQGTEGIGWYIDDVRLAGVDAVTQLVGPTAVNGTQFSFTPSQPGTVLLQARAGLYGYFGDWGSVKRVTVAAASQADCLFNWAERTYPGLLAPAAASITAGPWYFRYYSATGWYLGINSGNDHVYYLAPGGAPVDLGVKTGWFATAGC